ncbi:MAG: ABC transporter ATP-binding protein/permease [Oscillospiraceae bacterium]|nr:ABC transporter ATP-binding protein/permease [Oscillospiraceae bacterium]
MDKKTIKKALDHIGRYKLLLALTIVLSAVSVALSLYIPIVTGHAIDLITSQTDTQELFSLLFRIAVVAGIAALLQWATGLINNAITYRVLRDIRNEAFEKIQSLPLSYLDVHSTGDVMNRVIADAELFADGLLMGITQLFTGVATIVGSLIFMVRVNAGIALAVVVLTPISLFIARFIAKHTHEMFVKQAEVRGRQTGFVDEMLTNQKVVRAFTREKRQLEDFDRINNELEHCSLRAVFYSSLVNPTTRFVNNLVYAVVALCGALICIGSGVGGAFTVGSLISLLAYVNQYTKPFNEISGVVTELENAVAGAGRLFALLAETGQIPDNDDAYLLDDAQGDISINNVDFSYDPQRELIKKLVLVVKKGMKIAIVGPTGCGKTTLINLLMRFYDVDKGSISVDGHDIRDITRHSLRRSYGMVLQDTWLRSGTIKENIAIGKPDATDEEIIAAAKSSHAHGFIKRLPDGYDTYITEDGSGLSQGQKQLLCITRVMLALPPMIILDEATSSLDTRTEIQINRAFHKLTEGRTSFIVAHRLSTILEADLILVMKNGQIVEQGKHTELLEKGGFYSELYNSQYAVS